MFLSLLCSTLRFPRHFEGDSPVQVLAYPSGPSVKSMKDPGDDFDLTVVLNMRLLDVCVPRTLP